ncbi:amidohydrolase family protein [Actinophytocola sp. KF-1]
MTDHTRRTVLGAAVAVGAAGLLTRPATAAPRTHDGTAFVHATVIDPGSRQVRPDVTVLVRGDRITAVGRSVRVPAGTAVVDVRGGFVIPGLADLHVHSNGFAAVEPPLYVANGVTTVREMSGTPTVHDWRRRIEAGALLGPRWTVGSRIVDGRPSIWNPEHLPVVQVGNGAEARAAVRLQVAQGADFIKVYSRLSRSAFAAIAAEAGRQGVRFAGHVPDAVPVADAADLGMGTIEHLYGLFYATSTQEERLRADLARVRLELGDYNGWFNRTHPIEYAAMRTHSPVKARRLYDRLARRRVRMVPTLTMHDSLAHARALSERDDPRRKYLPAPALFALDFALREVYLKGRDPALDAGWAELFEAQRRLVLDLHQAGVTLMVGTDIATPGMVPGFSTHDELALLVSAGVPAMDALHAATAEPARYLGTRAGRVAPGHAADLVVLTASPLHDIRNTRRIAGVMVRGRYLDHQAREQLLRDVETAAAGIPAGAPLTAGCPCHAPAAPAS